MTLSDLSDYVQIFGILIAISGGVFAVIQLLEFKRQRRDAIVVELSRTFYSPDLAAAVAVLHTLPDERAAVIVTTTFETMGLLVYLRVANFEVVKGLAGGMIVVMWRKLRIWLDAVRSEQSQPSWAEWFQWLAERAAVHKDEARPAYVAHADWKP
jgi:hypothetical protein